MKVVIFSIDKIPSTTSGYPCKELKLSQQILKVTTIGQRRNLFYIKISSMIHCFAYGSVEHLTTLKYTNQDRK